MVPEPGAFMVRESTSTRGEFTLSVFDRHAVRHVRIHIKDGKYALRETPDEHELFATVTEMVSSEVDNDLLKIYLKISSILFLSRKPVQ